LIFFSAGGTSSSEVNSCTGVLIEGGIVVVFNVCVIHIALREKEGTLNTILYFINHAHGNADQT
jgi:hypothetical protein